MIAGVGLDMVEIERVGALVRRGAQLSRVYGPQELAFLQRRGKDESFAANFCAKEAFAKALGTGIRGFRLAEVQTLRDEAGRPYLALSGEARKRAGGLLFTVSLTHTRSTAAAVVIAERADGPIGE